MLPSLNRLCLKWPRKMSNTASEPQANKALHPTAYSFARRASLLRLQRQVSYVVSRRYY